MLPLLTPAAQVGGRALINILLLVYLLWALIAVPGSRMRVERPALLLYAALLLAYLLSVPGALDARAGFHEWIKFALHTLAFYFTLIVLARQPEAMRRFIAALGVAGLLLLAALLAVLPFKMQDPAFLPTTHMVEDNLPFLLPFSLYYLVVMRKLRWGRWIGLVLVAVVMTYVALSQGRAALAGLLAALIVYGMFVLRWPLGKVALVGLVLLAIAVGVSYETFFRQAGSTDWIVWLDKFTSFRSQLWRQALAHPPANALLGVGMANVSNYPEVVQVLRNYSLGHLHNFLFDAWYETGLLGLTALLAFVATPFVRGWRVARAGGEQGAWAGLFLASTTALLVAGLLSFSYASRQFALYLPMLLAALWSLGVVRRAST
ncbi:MAG: O-antigen ligase family protein [Gammaproteobacteria bacterium]|nr:O-antigen ligase family protein [Gammaproteobacteria bacterium]